MADIATRAAQPRSAIDGGSGQGEAAGSDVCEEMALPLASDAKEPLVTKAASDPTDSVAPDDGAQSIELPEAREVIEPGRALALCDFSPPASNAGERLVRLAYRIGIPGSVLAAPFRKPVRPRLLATVESPLSGNRVAGMALRAGHFLVSGSKAPIAQMDFSPVARLTPPFERCVHGFTWLADLCAGGTREQVTPTAERILAAWLKENARPGKGAAWSVGHAGHRLLGWLVHAPILFSGKELRTQALDVAAVTARWLDRHVTRAETRLDEVAGWCAIIAAGLLMPDGKPRRLFGEAGLARALGDLVGDDGGILSRSPLDQIEAICLLTDLTACYDAVNRDVPALVDSMQALLVPPLLALLHGDGGLGSWQGAGAVEADRISAVIEASRVRTRPLRDVRQWGYQRVSAGKSLLQFDAAPPPLARHTRTGCASTLAFEFSHREHRIIVNCGGAALAGGLVPVRIEQGLRASAAHSTLILDDANSTAVLIKGKLGSGVGEVEVDRRLLDLGDGGATRIEASHNGYVNRFGLTHRRILIMRDSGDELRGEDVLVPAARRGKRGKIGYAIRFHIGPGVQVGMGESGRSVGLALPDGTYWQFMCDGGATDSATVTIEESLWVDGMGRPHPTEQIVVSGLVSRGGGSVSWLLKKMG
ncbi:MAG: heparinase II/III family protein [Novosphingobium sp.]